MEIQIVISKENNKKIACLHWTCKYTIAVFFKKIYDNNT